MKKIMLTLMAIVAFAASASAMSYEQARNEALFLTDKMAYELNLTDAQYEAAYEINLDYLMGVTSRNDVFGPYWERRNLDLQYILYSWQWDVFRAATYFYRPLYWNAGYWHFGIYARYPHRDYFYFGRPHFYASYRGGHSWRMNGGRSYYEHHRDHFRPDTHRDNHVGMRDGWNRGDYRNNRGNSSTRITGHDNDHARQGGLTGNNREGNGRDGNASHNNSNQRDGRWSDRAIGNTRTGNGNDNATRQNRSSRISNIPARTATRMNDATGRSIRERVAPVEATRATTRQSSSISTISRATSAMPSRSVSASRSTHSSSATPSMRSNTSSSRSSASGNGIGRSGGRR